MSGSADDRWRCADGRRPGAGWTPVNTADGWGKACAECGHREEVCQSSGLTGGGCLACRMLRAESLAQDQARVLMRLAGVVRALNTDMALEKWADEVDEVGAPEPAPVPLKPEDMR